MLYAQVQVFDCIWNGCDMWCNHLFWFWLSADTWHLTLALCQQSAVCDTWQQLAGYWYITPGAVHGARCTITGVWSRVIGVNSMAHSGQTGCPSQEDHQRSWVRLPELLERKWERRGRGADGKPGWDGRTRRLVCENIAPRDAVTTLTSARSHKQLKV